jgi:hypothetical protein
MVFPEKRASRPSPKAAAQHMVPRAGKSVAEFCRGYGISRKNFENWTKRGVAPAIVQPTPGGRKIIPQLAENAWLRTQTGLIEPAE